jgi:hypothetical protein
MRINSKIHAKTSKLHQHSTKPQCGLQWIYTFLCSTGYEQVLISRVGEGYGNVAKQDGKVIGKTKDGLTIEYKHGTKEGFVIGRRFGKAPDFIVPHTMHSDLQEGAKFKAGDILTTASGLMLSRWKYPEL